ncbi:hypothetical protein [Mycoplasmopsis columbinasalis]|uniref:Uncharacterized protein n=1 Tax=Mycoplasmopsis columbinasalis TaxID=114880 RepID=A0A449BAX6_9BACT|nr:hypothetical protein [Mycoplasmopsis columbinasalis]VEU78355.1 Uncharacterised protein [Mycoplasmopsis columbinasalis]
MAKSKKPIAIVTATAGVLLIPATAGGVIAAQMLKTKEKEVNSITRLDQNVTSVAQFEQLKLAIDNAQEFVNAYKTSLATNELSSLTALISFAQQVLVNGDSDVTDKLKQRNALNKLVASTQLSLAVRNQTASDAQANQTFLTKAWNQYRALFKLSDIKVAFQQAFARFDKSADFATFINETNELIDRNDEAILPLEVKLYNVLYAEQLEKSTLSAQSLKTLTPIITDALTAIVENDENFTRDLVLLYEQLFDKLYATVAANIFSGTTDVSNLQPDNSEIYSNYEKFLTNAQQAQATIKVLNLDAATNATLTTLIDHIIAQAKTNFAFWNLSYKFAPETIETKSTTKGEKLPANGFEFLSALVAQITAEAQAYAQTFAVDDVQNQLKNLVNAFARKNIDEPELASDLIALYNSEQITPAKVLNNPSSTSEDYANAYTHLFTTGVKLNVASRFYLLLNDLYKYSLNQHVVPAPNANNTASDATNELNSNEIETNTTTVAQAEFLRQASTKLVASVTNVDELANAIFDLNNTYFDQVLLNSLYQDALRELGTQTATSQANYDNLVGLLKQDNANVNRVETAAESRDNNLRVYSNSLAKNVQEITNAYATVTWLRNEVQTKANELRNLNRVQLGYLLDYQQAFLDRFTNATNEAKNDYTEVLNQARNYTALTSAASRAELQSKLTQLFNYAQTLQLSNAQTNFTNVHTNLSNLFANIKDQLAQSAYYSGAVDPNIDPASPDAHPNVDNDPFYNALINVRRTNKAAFDADFNLLTSAFETSNQPALYQFKQLSYLYNYSDIAKANDQSVSAAYRNMAHSTLETLNKYIEALNRYHRNNHPVADPGPNATPTQQEAYSAWKTLKPSLAFLKYVIEVAPRYVANFVGVNQDALDGLSAASANNRDYQLLLQAATTNTQDAEVTVQINNPFFSVFAALETAFTNANLTNSVFVHNLFTRLFKLNADFVLESARATDATLDEQAHTQSVDRLADLRNQMLDIQSNVALLVQAFKFHRNWQANYGQMNYLLPRLYQAEKFLNFDRLDLTQQQVADHFRSQTRFSEAVDLVNPSGVADARLTSALTQALGFAVANGKVSKDELNPYYDLFGHTGTVLADTSLPIDYNAIRTLNTESQIKLAKQNFVLSGAQVTFNYFANILRLLHTLPASSLVNADTSTIDFANLFDHAGEFIVLKKALTYEWTKLPQEGKYDTSDPDSQRQHFNYFTRSLLLTDTLIRFRLGLSGIQDYALNAKAEAASDTNGGAWAPLFAPYLSLYNTDSLTTLTQNDRIIGEFVKAYFNIQSYSNSTRDGKVYGHFILTRYANLPGSLIRDVYQSSDSVNEFLTNKLLPYVLNFDRFTAALSDQGDNAYQSRFIDGNSIDANNDVRQTKWNKDLAAKLDFTNNNKTFTSANIMDFANWAIFTFDRTNAEALFQPMTAELDNAPVRRFAFANNAFNRALAVNFEILLNAYITPPTAVDGISLFGTATVNLTDSVPYANFDQALAALVHQNNTLQAQANTFKQIVQALQTYANIYDLHNELSDQAALVNDQYTNLLTITNTDANTTRKLKLSELPRFQVFFGQTYQAYLKQYRTWLAKLNSLAKLIDQGDDSINDLLGEIHRGIDTFTVARNNATAALDAAVQRARQIFEVTATTSLDNLLSRGWLNAADRNEVLANLGLSNEYVPTQLSFTVSDPADAANTHAYKLIDLFTKVSSATATAPAVYAFLNLETLGNAYPQQLLGFLDQLEFFTHDFVARYQKVASVLVTDFTYSAQSPVALNHIDYIARSNTLSYLLHSQDQFSDNDLWGFYAKMWANAAVQHSDANTGATFTDAQGQVITQMTSQAATKFGRAFFNLPPTFTTTLPTILGNLPALQNALDAYYDAKATYFRQTTSLIQALGNYVVTHSSEHANQPDRANARTFDESVVPLLRVIMNELKAQLFTAGEFLNDLPGEAEANRYIDSATVQDITDLTARYQQANQLLSKLVAKVALAHANSTPEQAVVALNNRLDAWLAAYQQAYVNTLPEDLWTLLSAREQAVLNDLAIPALANTNFVFSANKQDANAKLVLQALYLSDYASAETFVRTVFAQAQLTNDQIHRVALAYLQKLSLANFLVSHYGSVLDVNTLPYKQLQTYVLALKVQIDALPQTPDWSAVYNKLSAAVFALDQYSLAPANSAAKVYINQLAQAEHELMNVLNVYPELVQSESLYVAPLALKNAQGAEATVVNATNWNAAGVYYNPADSASKHKLNDYYRAINPASPKVTLGFNAFNYLKTRTDGAVASAVDDYSYSTWFDLAQRVGSYFAFDANTPLFTLSSLQTSLNALQNFNRDARTYIVNKNTLAAQTRSITTSLATIAESLSQGTTLKQNLLNNYHGANAALDHIGTANDPINLTTTYINGIQKQIAADFLSLYGANSASFLESMFKHLYSKLSAGQNTPGVPHSVEGTTLASLRNQEIANANGYVTLYARAYTSIANFSNLAARLLVDDNTLAKTNINAASALTFTKSAVLNLLRMMFGYNVDQAQSALNTSAGFFLYALYNSYGQKLSDLMSAFKDQVLKFETDQVWNPNSQRADQDAEKVNQFISAVDALTSKLYQVANDFSYTLFGLDLVGASNFSVDLNTWNNETAPALTQNAALKRITDLFYSAGYVKSAPQGASWSAYINSINPSDRKTQLFLTLYLLTNWDVYATKQAGPSKASVLTNGASLNTNHRPEAFFEGARDNVNTGQLAKENLSGDTHAQANLTAFADAAIYLLETFYTNADGNFAFLNHQSFKNDAAKTTFAKFLLEKLLNITSNTLTNQLKPADVFTNTSVDSLYWSHGNFPANDLFNKIADKTIALNGVDTRTYLATFVRQIKLQGQNKLQDFITSALAGLWNDFNVSESSDYDDLLATRATKSPYDAFAQNFLTKVAANLGEQNFSNQLNAFGTDATALTYYNQLYGLDLQSALKLLNTGANDEVYSTADTDARRRLDEYLSGDTAIDNPGLFDLLRVYAQNLKFQYTLYKPVWKVYANPGVNDTALTPVFSTAGARVLNKLDASVTNITSLDTLDLPYASFLMNTKYGVGFNGTTSQTSFADFYN